MENKSGGFGAHMSAKHDIETWHDGVPDAGYDLFCLISLKISSRDSCEGARWWRRRLSATGLVACS